MRDTEKIKIELAVNCIGPHSDTKSINYNGQTRDLKTAIYAPNGSGKTFISRMFALSESANEEDYANYLTLNKDSGDFSFVINHNDKRSFYSVHIQKGQNVVIKNSGDYLYHVFNSDYVRKNINDHSYNIDGSSITGVIVGESNIDLSYEKSQLAQYSLEKEKIILAKMIFFFYYIAL